MTSNERILRVGKKGGRAHKSPDHISHVLSFCEVELLLFQIAPVKSLEQNTKSPPHGNFVISEWNIAFISPIWLNNLQDTSSIKCSLFYHFPYGHQTSSTQEKCISKVYLSTFLYIHLPIINKMFFLEVSISCQECV